MQPYKNIDEYIDWAPERSRDKISELRKLVKEIVPDAGEKISYGIPTFTINDKYFIYIAGYKDHVSIHPVSPAMEKIKGITSYRTGKGTLQFPLDQPLPLTLIRRIIKTRFKEQSSTRVDYFCT